MKGNVGCCNYEPNVQLTITNTSLSSGNRKFTNDLISGFFLSPLFICKIFYLKHH